MSWTYFVMSWMSLYLCSVIKFRNKVTQYMKNTTEPKTIEQRKTELAERLLKIKDNWPFPVKQHWCITNGYNTESINKGYLRGSIGSIVVAEKLIEVIELYMDENAAAA